MGEVIIWAAIAALVVKCLMNIVSDLKHGTCSGCSSCGHCSHCSGDHGHCSHGGGGHECSHGVDHHESHSESHSDGSYAGKSMTNDDLRQLMKAV